MTKCTRRSARKELKGIVERALQRELEIPDRVVQRVVNRIIRQSGRIAEISEPLRTAAPTRPKSPSFVCPAFDPYAFGAVVVLQKHGPEALMDRLSAIESAENLRSLAIAQNLAITAADGSSSEELRAAIVHGAAQRLAERRAAAS
jgi:hypothetical protein